MIWTVEICQITELSDIYVSRIYMVLGYMYFSDILGCDLFSDGLQNRERKKHLKNFQELKSLGS